MQHGAAAQLAQIAGRPREEKVEEPSEVRLAAASMCAAQAQIEARDMLDQEIQACVSACCQKPCLIPDLLQGKYEVFGAEAVEQIKKQIFQGDGRPLPVLRELVFGRLLQFTDLPRIAMLHPVLAGLIRFMATDPELDAHIKHMIETDIVFAVQCEASQTDEKLQEACGISLAAGDPGSQQMVVPMSSTAPAARRALEQGIVESAEGAAEDDMKRREQDRENQLAQEAARKPVRIGRQELIDSIPSEGGLVFYWLIPYNSDLDRKMPKKKKRKGKGKDSSTQGLPNPPKVSSLLCALSSHRFPPRSACGV